MTFTQDRSADRRYVCTDCDSIVRARWSDHASFVVGCDCTTMDSCPYEMGQYETPPNWRVERPECCRDYEREEMEIEDRAPTVTYRCPECGAVYGSRHGEMRERPEREKNAVEDDAQTTIGRA